MGMMFKINEQTVFFTSDTLFAPHQLVKFYSMSDVILHDCEVAKFKSGVHAHYEDLKHLEDAIKKKMWLYHYQPGDKVDCTADGFQGWLKKKQEIYFI